MPTKEEMQAILDAPVGGSPEAPDPGDLSACDPADFIPRPGRPDFPTALDNTTISTFRACAQKAFRAYFQHLHPRGRSIHLVAGGAFAKGLEAARNAFYRDGESPVQAMLQGVRALIHEWGDYPPFSDSHPNKSLDQMVLALVEALHHWPLGSDVIVPFEVGSRNGVEFSFAVPLPGTCHPQTGEPILYTGRIDLLGIYGGALFCEDDKTTAALGPSWGRQWDLRSQFLGYSWALQEHDYPVAGTLVRGISPQKSGIKTAEVIIYQPPWKIDRWLKQTQRDVARMVECWREGYWDYDFGDACTAFGGCAYAPLCNSQHPEQWIRSNYVRREWNPLGLHDPAHDPREVKK